MYLVTIIFNDGSKNKKRVLSCSTSSELLKCLEFYTGQSKVVKITAKLIEGKDNGKKEI